MINLTLNSTGPAPQAAPIAAAGIASLDGASAAPQDAGAALPFTALPFAALPFADLLGQLDEGAAVDATADAAAADGSAAAEPAPKTDDSDGDAGQPPVLTAAMTMTMPLLPAALAAANAVANAVAAATATATGPRAGASGGEAPRAEPGAAIATAVSAGPIPSAVAVALPPAAVQAPRATPPARPAADTTMDVQAFAGIDVQASAATASHAVAAAVPTAADGASDLAVKADASVPRDVAGVPGAALAAPAPAATPAGTDTVALSGPPTAWRQSLREALGERLQLQAGHGLEQAVIRLDPPQLGRVEIAIRHSAGSLEVTLSATHGEVLRQLHGVSESLRSDLAQRQYVDVAVTVTPAPRNAAANPFGGDAQGRGRQSGREQEQRTPGLALLDDGPAASGFSLTGRD
jgi:flagellar hook-length control protein FliK